MGRSSGNSSGTVVEVIVEKVEVVAAVAVVEVAVVQL